MVDIYLDSGKLPADINSDQLQKELPANCYLTIKRDSEKNVLAVIVHCPDGVDTNLIETTVKNHALLKTEEEEAAEKKDSEKSIIDDIVARLEILESKIK